MRRAGRRAALVALVAAAWCVEPLRAQHDGAPVERGRTCRPGNADSLVAARHERPADGWTSEALVRTAAGALGEGGGRDMRPCELAERARDIEPGTCADACRWCARRSSAPGACFTPSWPDLAAAGLTGQLTPPARRGTPEGAPSWDELRTEVSRRRGCGARPVLVVRALEGGGSDAFVVTGFDVVNGERWVHVADARETCGPARVLALRHEALAGGPGFGAVHWLSVTGLARGEDGPRPGDFGTPVAKMGSDPIFGGAGGEAPREARKAASDLVPDLCAFVDCRVRVPPSQQTAVRVDESWQLEPSWLGRGMEHWLVRLDALAAHERAADPRELLRVRGGWMFPVSGREPELSFPLPRQLGSPSTTAVRATVVVAEVAGAWSTVAVLSGEWGARLERARARAGRGPSARARDVFLVSVPALDRHYAAHVRGEELWLSEIGSAPGEPVAGEPRPARDVFAALAADARGHDGAPR